MEQEKGIRNNRRNKHLNREELIQIKTLQREGLSSGEIGGRLGRSSWTIRRELK